MDSSQFNDPMIMRQIIVEHYQNPENKGIVEDSQDYININQKSSTCIDNLTVGLKIIEQRIIDANFDGIGCAISTASTDIIASLIKGQDIGEAKAIINNYLLMIKQQNYDEELITIANVFKNTYKQMARIKCAIIGVNGFLKIINSLERS